MNNADDCQRYCFCSGSALGATISLVKREETRIITKELGFPKKILEQKIFWDKEEQRRK